MRRARLRLPLALIPLFAFTSCSGGEPAAGPLTGYSVVLINVDALRADHLGAYGYERDTSPFFDSVARSGVVFDRAISASSYTRESVAALLSGRLPSRSGALGWKAAPPRDQPHLGDVFRAAGYRSGFLSNTLQLKNPGFTSGFEEVQHLPRRWDTSGEGEKLSRRALEFVKRVQEERFFLYLHYLDPHAPYAPRPELVRRFTSRPFEAPLALYREVEPRIPDLVRDGFGPGDPRFDDLVLRYDAEVASTDRAIALLFDGLAALDRLDRCLVVITADHGEEFLEHGFVEHAWALYDESIHVPLVFWAPGVLLPGRVGERVAQVDVFPTLADFFSIDGQELVLDGRPLFELREGRWEPRVLRRPHFAELLLRERNVARAVIVGDWKYVAAQRWLPVGARSGAVRQDVDLSGAPVREELYHLLDDPGEERDRSAESPERLAELQATMRDFVTENSAVLREAVERDPEAPAVSPEDAERLRALGYH